MVHIWWMCIAQSKYVSCWHIVKTYAVFAFILLACILMGVFI